MKQLFILLSFAIITGSQVLAQTGKNNRSFAIEVDPIAYILKGYSLHGIYQASAHWSFDAGVFGIEEPEFYSDNKDFKVMHKGLGVKVHYYLGGIKTKGLYVGLGTAYSASEAKHKESEVKSTGNTWGAGIHAGYRFFMFKNNQGKGLYFTPWVSLDYQLYQDKIHFESADYKQNKWSVFPTVHIGYRF